MVTYCRSTSQGRTDTGSHLIISTANRLQLVSLHSSLGIFLWKTCWQLSSQRRKCWSIWNSVGEVFADPHASLLFLYDLSFMFGSLITLMLSLYRVLVLCLSIQWILFNLFFSFSNSRYCLCVCHSAFGLASSRNRLFRQWCSWGYNSGVEHLSHMPNSLGWIPQIPVNKSANRVEERKTGEARLQVYLLRREPWSISRSIKKGNWGEKEFNKGSSSWLTGFCLSGESGRECRIGCCQLCWGS